MNQLANSATICSLEDVPEFSRLFHHIQSSAIDSEGVVIKHEEVLQVLNAVIQRLVWCSSQLDQIIQEELDELRFSVSIISSVNDVNLVRD